MNSEEVYMEQKRRTIIAVIVVLIISVLGIGIAFAAFSRNLTINGNGTIQSSAFKIVFEGLNSASTLDAPTLTGTAAVTTPPTIKNNATEISNFVATLRSPGDSITYNFKIHNDGDYAATVSSVVMASGVNLTTNSSKQSSAANTLNAMDYKLYYTDNNALVGSGTAKDCLEPGEEENVSLRIVFSSTDVTNTNVLPTEDLLLDNLGVTVNYSQSTNGSCAIEQAGDAAVNAPFVNFDGAYYEFEEKSFIGTGVNRIIVSENTIDDAEYATAYGSESGGTITFAEKPAATAAATYCTGCRLMTRSEAISWGCPTANGTGITKCIATNGTSAENWWLAEASTTRYGWTISLSGYTYDYVNVTHIIGVRPATDVPSGATMTGSGTQASPYVITSSSN